MGDTFKVTREKMVLVCRIKRIEKVSCAHRLHSTALTDEENKIIFGKCNNMHGHGHNYTFEAIIKGPIHKNTGMVMNIALLKSVMQDILGQIDHKFIDREVEYFKDVASTAENLALWFFNELKDGLEIHRQEGDQWEVEE